jgi:hypothetical protein
MGSISVASPPRLRNDRPWGKPMRKRVILAIVLCVAGCTQYPRTSTYVAVPPADDGFRPLAGFECDDGSIGPTAQSCRTLLANTPSVAPRGSARAARPEPTPVAYTPPTPAQQPVVITSASPEPQESPPPPKSKEMKAALMTAGIAALIVQESRAAYYATGHPCACPDDQTRNGRSCGNMSAYIRPGAHPLCYPSDVTAAMVETYRQRQASR